MIGKLTGIVDTIAREGLILDVQGVGYLVFVSGATQGRLAPGEPASLWIETHIREDHIHLFGFSSMAERDWFRLLTGVQGVGGRVGLAILSVLQPDEIAIAIAAQDKRAFSRADGVGPRLAARIVTELKDKTANISLGASAGPAAVPDASSGVMDEALSALANLGFERSIALSAIAKARGTLGSERADSLDAVLQAALKELAK